MSDDRTAIAEEEDVVDEQETETEPEAEPEADGGEPGSDEPAEGDEPEGDEPEGDDPEGEVEPEPQGGRRETRVQRLANERRQLRQDKERLERELAEARAPRQVEQPRETPQQREERLAMMDDRQRTEYLLNERDAYWNNRTTALERTVLATSDKSSFDSECARKPHFEAVADAVEVLFQKYLSEGRFIPRATLARHEIGDRIDKRGGKALAQQRRRGRERVAGQRTRAPGGGSDVTAERRQRGDTAAAREARLSKEEI